MFFCGRGWEFFVVASSDCYYVPQSTIPVKPKANNCLISFHRNCGKCAHVKMDEHDVIKVTPDQTAS